MIGGDVKTQREKNREFLKIFLAVASFRVQSRNVMEDRAYSIVSAHVRPCDVLARKSSKKLGEGRLRAEIGFIPLE
jgi:hypothetical protein